MLDFVEILEENPLVTVSNLNKELRRRYPNKPEICDKTLSNAIDGLAFTLKLSRDTPAQRNSSETKVDRKQHVEWMMSTEVVYALKIYIDEFGSNTSAPNAILADQEKDNDHFDWLRPNLAATLPSAPLSAPATV